MGFEFVRKGRKFHGVYGRLGDGNGDGDDFVGKKMMG